MTQDRGTGAAPPRRDRVVAVASLIAVAALAWAYTAQQANLMREMDQAMWRDMNMSMNGMPPVWTPLSTLLLLVMWTAMMAAMMVPGIFPVVTAFAAINRRRRERDAPYVPTAVFLAGYLIVWAAFSILATSLQWLLQQIGLVTAMMQSASYYLSAALFVTAGLYQFSPFKEMCLAYCRSPDGFILSEWRDGSLGAARMGVRHGLFCLGCCAALMILLFAVAIMDLRWVAALTVLVTAEKLLPGARFWRLAIGAGLLAAGVGFALAGLRAA
jgi:predicted metal-binding membrane protein